MSEKIWQAKLAAFIHDPATKALILMRMKHDAGSVAELRKAIFQFNEVKEVLESLEDVVKQADWWASAADRPQLPMSLRVGINFASNPALIHPLTGEYFPIQGFVDHEDAKPDVFEELSFDHFQNLVVKNNSGEIDWKKTFLSFWRFGKDAPAPGLGALWGELPADTRSPDHSIWEHLSLTSAFAGALAEEDGEPALLLVSFGPVQGFIAQARSVSDLWAGSHFLSTMAWRGMKVICENYGPDTILFPNLRGIPLVDVWLRREQNIPWAKGASYPAGASDANPLFIAALPNRFVALVPEEKATELAKEIKETVRTWCQERAYEVLGELDLRGNETAKKQIEQQFRDFPEVYWAMVPWRLGGSDNWDDSRLREILTLFGFDNPYLDQPLDGLLKKEIKIGNEQFYTPNPGVAYPGLYESLERLHAAVKLERTFSECREEGYRCSICGEREWLTDNRGALKKPPGKRGNTVWTRLEGKGIKKGEHLCGLCALKRFWPRLFVRWIKEQEPDLTNEDKSLHRYVVSTHTMALATSIWNWIKKHNDKQEEAQKDIAGKMKDFSESAALPRKLYWELRKGSDPGLLDFFRRLPPYLDSLRDDEEQGTDKYEEFLARLKDLFGHRPEAYYGLILMDGDEMGKWLAGKKATLTLGHRFHEKVKKELEEKGLSEYLCARRPTSPAWHQAISSALNNFSIHIARFVVEDLFMGKLIYSGGDDLLAMVAVYDLPAMMLALRCAYSGILPWKGAGASGEYPWQWLTCDTVPKGLKLKLKNGYALIQSSKEKKLLRMMGGEATASMGAVIAHHKAPLGRVMRLLRAMEKRAKERGGRDAFSIALVKRSGGEIWFDGKWNLMNNNLQKSDMGLLIRTRNLLAHEELSRRAVYILVETLRDIPSEESALREIMVRQFRQQGAKEEVLDEAQKLARDLAKSAISHQIGEPDIEKEWDGPNLWLRNVFITAEFLARNGRVPMSS